MESKTEKDDTNEEEGRSEYLARMERELSKVPSHVFEFPDDRCRYCGEEAYTTNAIEVCDKCFFSGVTECRFCGVLFNWTHDYPSDICRNCATHFVNEHREKMGLDPQWFCDKCGRRYVSKRDRRLCKKCLRKIFKEPDKPLDFSPFRWWLKTFGRDRPRKRNNLF